MQALNHLAILSPARLHSPIRILEDSQSPQCEGGLGPPNQNQNSVLTKICHVHLSPMKTVPVSEE